MGRIHVLDDHLINRIAAGEVVERPASVVKELVENSLDAGARSIEIVAEAGGKRAIHVRDDGSGMDRDDALLALERHATSKLRRPEDLETIATLGFRGEALPSIAAVSRFLLRTAPHDGEGTEVEVRAGKIVAVRELGLPRGTTIAVERLFANVPARCKFLRADSTELAHITRVVTHYALAHPDVRFRLEHAGRRLIEAPPAGRLEERIAQLKGPAFVGALLPVELGRGAVQVHGLAGRPAESLPRRTAQHLFVNGRLVQDRVLTHAIHQAYGNTMPSGRYPAVILFVDLDPALVDVNVHPQKTEVRFRRGGEVHDVVRDAIAGALSVAGAIPTLSELRPGALPGGRPSAAGEAAARYLELHEPRPVATGAASGGSSHRASPAVHGEPPRAAAGAEAAAADGSSLLREMEQGSGATARALAQYRDSYILAQDERGLLIVDQHAAQERVLFERFLADADRDRVEVQRLMFPQTVELAADERVVLEQEADEFRRLGFSFEPFGGDTVRLDAVPALVKELDPAVLLRELLGEAGRSRSARSAVESLRYRLVTTAACKAAIKINHPLNPTGMQRLLDDLAATGNPTTCPHGRPLVFRLTLEEIERAFHRR